MTTYVIIASVTFTLIIIFFYNRLTYTESISSPSYNLVMQDIQNISRYTGEKIPINEKCNLYQKIVSEPIHPQVLTWECSKENTCAGLGDQIRSLVSLFVYANDRNYKFNILWKEPYDIYPEILLPNLYDWKNKTKIINSKKMSSFNNCDWNMDYDFIRIATSQQFNDNSDCDNWVHIDTAKIMKYWLDDYKPQVRGCGFWYLFKFGSYLEKKLSHYEKELSDWLKDKVYKNIITIQIRTGDQVLLGNKKPTDHLLNGYLKCAIKIQDELGLKDVVYFLTTDSYTLKQKAKKKYNNYIFTTSIEPRHSGIATTGLNYLKKNGKDIITESLVEVIMIAKTNVLIRSHSGFGISAEHLGLMNNVVTYPECKL